MSSWLVEQTEDAVVHIMPMHDLIEHVFASNCLCGPSVGVLETKVLGYAWIYTHHALDGRR